MVEIPDLIFGFILVIFLLIGMWIIGKGINSASLQRTVPVRSAALAIRNFRSAIKRGIDRLNRNRDKFIFPLFEISTLIAVILILVIVANFSYFSTIPEILGALIAILGIIIAMGSIVIVEDAKDAKIKREREDTLFSILIDECGENIEALAHNKNLLLLEQSMIPDNKKVVDSLEPLSNQSWGATLSNLPISFLNNYQINLLRRIYTGIKRINEEIDSRENIRIMPFSSMDFLQKIDGIMLMNIENLGEWYEELLISIDYKIVLIGPTHGILRNW